MAALNIAGSAAFVPGTKAFVPKSKKPEEEYPAIGTTTNSKQPAAKNNEKDEDPCRGMPKEFFIYEFNQMANVCILWCE